MRISKKIKMLLLKKEMNISSVVRIRNRYSKKTLMMRISKSPRVLLVMHSPTTKTPVTKSI